MHQRRKSKEEGDLPESIQNLSTDVNSESSDAHGGHRHRVYSTPTSPSHLLSEDKRTELGLTPAITLTPTQSTFPHIYSHSRTRSTVLPSLLSTNFPSSQSNESASPQPQSLATQLSPTQIRRHSRIHSRNLSIYFPRPGESSISSVAEDSFQELEFKKPPEENSLALQDAPAPRKLNPNFKFGGKPPDRLSPPPTLTARRGHHHKHSVSHNFFSFLEPGATIKTNTSLPSEANSPTPQSAPYSVQSFPSPINKLHPMAFKESSFRIPCEIVAFGAMQFLLGALVWVEGQKSGSLSCTGLGYWVVFDAFGVILAKVLPRILARQSSQASSRSYGNARLETLALFAQSIYLVFTSIYICKETVEHVLLSANETKEAHHHHHRSPDTLDLIKFPRFPVLLSLFSIVWSSFRYENHLRLVDAIGNHLPFSWEYFYSIIWQSRVPLAKAAPNTRLGVLFTNPYSVSSLLFSICLTSASFIAPFHFYRSIDLLLASLETIVTFSIAYPASVALGKVLLQTAPPRGLLSGRMEAFLKIMRELERHPDVSQLISPHIWQLNAPSHGSYEHGNLLTETLIVTVKFAVHADLDDESILRLTRWTWERITSALGGSGASEVTIGIVRDQTSQGKRIPSTVI